MKDDNSPAAKRPAPKSENLYSVQSRIGRQARAVQNGHAGGVLWLTGLSASGKSTLALALEQRLFERGYQTYVLDGDNVRQGLNSDLGFAPQDRNENIRRVGEVAALFADSGSIVITAFISPYRADRDLARAAAPGLFHEVHVDASLAACEERDPKGLYSRARRGEIPEFTGISAPYEEPTAPELVVKTENASVADSVEQLVEYVVERFAADTREPQAA